MPASRRSLLALAVCDKCSRSNRREAFYPECATRETQGRRRRGTQLLHFTAAVFQVASNAERIYEMPAWMPKREEGGGGGGFEQSGHVAQFIVTRRHDAMRELLSIWLELVSRVPGPNYNKMRCKCDAHHHRNGVCTKFSDGAGRLQCFSCLPSDEVLINGNSELRAVVLAHRRWQNVNNTKPQPADMDSVTKTI